MFINLAHYYSCKELQAVDSELMLRSGFVDLLPAEIEEAMNYAPKSNRPSIAASSGRRISWKEKVQLSMELMDKLDQRMSTISGIQRGYNPLGTTP